MGTKLKDIVSKREISFDDLKGKIIAVDSYNILYQFITTIRQQDGSPLTDSKGNITSHLSGLFHRTIRLLTAGIKPVFVFDGKPPELKRKERERREASKALAHKEYEIAKEREDIDGMKKYAGRTAKLTREMIDEAKELLSAMGVPFIDAPSEGEAQAAHMVRRGDCYASVSQDYDSLLFGTPRLIQNLTVSERRKLGGRLAYQEVKPEIILLDENLKSLSLSQDKLIVLGILIGTDYNYGGINGIGPKKALKILQERDDFDRIFEELGWSGHFDFPWKDVYSTIKDMPTTDDYSLKWKDADIDAIKRILCERHEFSSARVDSAMEKLIKEKERRTQKGLGDFFR